MTTMIDEKFAALRTHRNNITRYRRLLKTQLTEFERQFIERRLSEERSAMERVASSTFPLSFGIPTNAMQKGFAETASGYG
jgi:hypothetical protein